MSPEAEAEAAARIQAKVHEVLQPFLSPAQALVVDLLPGCILVTAKIVTRGGHGLQQPLELPAEELRDILAGSGSGDLQILYAGSGSQVPDLAIHSPQWAAMSTDPLQVVLRASGNSWDLSHWRLSVWFKTLHEPSARVPVDPASLHWAQVPLGAEEALMLTFHVKLPAVPAQGPLAGFLDVALEDETRAPDGSIQCFRMTEVLTIPVISQSEQGRLAAAAHLFVSPNRQRPQSAFHIHYTLSAGLDAELGSRKVPEKVKGNLVESLALLGSLVEGPFSDSAIRQDLTDHLLQEGRRLQLSHLLTWIAGLSLAHKCVSPLPPNSHEQRCPDITPAAGGVCSTSRRPGRRTEAAA